MSSDQGPLKLGQPQLTQQLQHPALLVSDLLRLHIHPPQLSTPKPSPPLFHQHSSVPMLAQPQLWG
ncbi:hypothetical protein PAXRUDRAFT_20771 [Paxillus rubicundulus Ve08.2h10]|uniref:Uncharacterized protein n=1 Tax=Paxillus rubicundulus Ve08.2h10 TaxID=930991 RepID=A0A0D0CD98_9AGAM|nr:hypothetical protein PAXRUDRAFT_20771 [Paxillus rubicundulus Ve08.2h10]